MACGPSTTSRRTRSSAIRQEFGRLFVRVPSRLANLGSSAASRTKPGLYPGLCWRLTRHPSQGTEVVPFGEGRRSFRESWRSVGPPVLTDSSPAWRPPEINNRWVKVPATAERLRGRRRGCCSDTLGGYSDICRTVSSTEINGLSCTQPAKTPPFVPKTANFWCRPEIGCGRIPSWLSTEAVIMFLLRNSSTVHGRATSLTRTFVAPFLLQKSMGYPARSRQRLLHSSPRLRTSGAAQR